MPHLPEKIYWAFNQTYTVNQDKLDFKTLNSETDSFKYGDSGSEPRFNVEILEHSFESKHVFLTDLLTRF